MAKKYYWLKLMGDFFTQPKIKKLRKIAGGDTYTIIYLKLQLLSLKNDGKLFFEGIEDNIIEEIALTIDEDTDNVQVTFQYLLTQGLIEEVTQDEYLMTETCKLIGSESDSAKRVRKHRKNKVLEEKALLCNSNVTNCNTEIEIELDKEIELDIDKKIVPNKNVEEPATIKLLLKNGDEYIVNDQQVKDWEEIYTDIDVSQELRIMAEWCKNNPKKRKTKNGIVRFIINWLNREKDRKCKGSTKEDWSFFDD